MDKNMLSQMDERFRVVDIFVSIQKPQLFLETANCSTWIQKQILKTFSSITEWVPFLGTALEGWPYEKFSPIF